MLATPLVWTAASGAAVATAFTGVGVLLFNRAMRDPNRAAAGWLAAWWFAIGFATLMNVVGQWLLAMGDMTVASHAILLLASALAIGAGAAGLIGYCHHLAYGRGAPVVAAIMAAIYSLLMIGLVLALQPVAVDPTVRPVVQFARGGEWAVALLAPIVLAPPLAASAWLIALGLRLEDAGLRWRTVRVGSLPAMWVLAALTAVWASGWVEWWGTLAIEAVMVAMALTTYPGEPRRRSSKAQPSST